jgi:hypothetical protein
MRASGGQTPGRSLWADRALRGDHRATATGASASTTERRRHHHFEAPGRAGPRIRLCIRHEQSAVVAGPARRRGDRLSAKDFKRARVPPRGTYEMIEVTLGQSCLGAVRGLSALMCRVSGRSGGLLSSSRGCHCEARALRVVAPTTRMRPYRCDRHPDPVPCRWRKGWSLTVGGRRVDREKRVQIRVRHSPARHKDGSKRLATQPPDGRMVG